MKKIIGVLIVCLGFMEAKAQLTPGIQQFMFNPVMVNPSMAGLHNNQVQLAYDTRWIGLDGAPKTAFIRYDKMFSGNTGWDLAIVSDRIGPLSSVSLQNAFSYHVQTSSETRLAFGIKHHLSQSYLNLSGNNLIDPSDPQLTDNQTGIPVNNFDASVAFYNPNNYMIGFSYRNLIPQPNFRYANALAVPILSLHGWYSYDFSDEFSLESFLILTTARNTPMNTSIGVMGAFQHKFGVGLNFSPKNQIGVFAYIKASDKFNIFYNYNLPLSDISKISMQSHALGLSIRLGKDTPAGNKFFIQPTNESTVNRLF